jgi:hypothetical protein
MRTPTNLECASNAPSYVSMWTRRRQALWFAEFFAWMWWTTIRRPSWWVAFEQTAFSVVIVCVLTAEPLGVVGSLPVYAESVRESLRCCVQPESVCGVCFVVLLCFFFFLARKTQPFLGICEKVCYDLSTRSSCCCHLQLSQTNADVRECRRAECRDAHTS